MSIMDNTYDIGEECISSQKHVSILQLQAWDLLEFTNIREQVSNLTRLLMSREMAVAMRPKTNLEDIEHLQEETSEATLMLDTVGDISLSGVHDPRDLLRRCSIDGVLSGEEIISLVNLLDSTWHVRNKVISMKGKTPLLKEIAHEIPDLRALSNEVITSISPQGEVLSSATPKLRRLRLNVSKTFQRVMRVMERIANSENVRNSLQSGAIATRGERLVLEVRSDARESVTGIVHDVSASGSTLFVEPIKAVELCNEWRETTAEAQREEERILRQISRLIGNRKDEALSAFEATATIDFITARARYGTSIKARRIKTMPAGSDNVVNLIDARHPLLGKNAVPVTINIGPGFRGLVITGPNTGGKTVAIKTIGLFALMHQSGLQVPVSNGEMSIFDGVYADIGDAQSIERSISTFSSHMGRVIEILIEANSNSLILLDELGTGTDPEEGSALAKAILEHASENDIPIAITSHYRTVAEYAAESENLANASVELDPNSMLPTYKIIMGIPGRSYAIHVARHLGMPNHVIDNAENLMDPTHNEAETILQQLQREREESKRTNAEAETAKKQAEATLKDLQIKLKNVTKFQEDMIEKSRQELRVETEKIQRSLRKIITQAKNDHDLDVAKRAIGRVRNQFSDPTWLPITATPDSKNSQNIEEGKHLKPGDIIEINGLNVEAEVIGIGGEGTVKLMMGNSHIELNRQQVKLVRPYDSDEQKKTANQIPSVTIRTTPVDETDTHKGELDIRGLRIYESDEIIRQFIDDCAMQGLTVIKIIHGEGTGALRETVRVLLSKHSLVGSFSAAPDNQGGNGATVINLN